MIHRPAIHFCSIALSFILLVASPLLLASSCGQLARADFLLGEWQTNQAGSTISEHWWRVDDENFQGMGINDNAAEDKPAFVESLRMLAMSGSVYLLAKVPENPLPVAFQLVDCGDTSLRFENAEHDFPKAIEYKKVSSSEVKAEVYGDKGLAFTLNYQRVNGTDQSQVVRRFIDAYNTQNLDAMMSLADESIRWMSVVDDKMTLETSGKNALRLAMQGYFSGELKTHSQLLKVGTSGDFVWGLERASWHSKGKNHQSCAPVVYELSASKVKNVWYYSAISCP